ncbi:MAG: hypothetical protein ABIG71_00015, partial [Candidatus Uhrbacteria bacterium]
MDERQQIVIESDGSALFTRERELPGKDGGLPKVHCMDKKRVDARVLFSTSGGFPCLPRHCRIHVEQDGRSVFVTEDLPCVRTVFWKAWDELRGRMREHEDWRSWGVESEEAFEYKFLRRDRFSLALPYVVRVYIFTGNTLDRVEFFYRIEPIISANDELLRPNLPNRHNTYALCMSDQMKKAAVSRKSIPERIALLEDGFWGSSFNYDLREAFLDDARRFKEFRTPWHWERASLQDPSFVLRIPWLPQQCTIGDRIRVAIGGVRDSGPLLFNALCERVASADEWHGAPVIEDTEAGVRVSTSRTIALHNAVISIGDRVKIAKGQVVGCARSGTYTVEWFGMVDGGAVRAVKLGGIKQPIPLIRNGKLESGVQIVATNVEMIEVAEVAITAGTLVNFSNRALWQTTGIREVLSVHRDRDGTVLVQFAGERTRTPIAQGDEFAAGVHVLAPELTKKDGSLDADMVRLGDGTVVRVGDRCLYRVHERVCENTVKCLLPLNSTDNYLRRAVLNGTPGGSSVVSVEDVNGALAKNIVLLPKEMLSEIALEDGTIIRLRDRMRVGAVTKRITELSPLLAGSYYACLQGSWIRYATSEGLANKVVLFPEVRINDDGLSVSFGGRVFEAGVALFDGSECTLHVVESFVKRSDYNVDAQCADGTIVPFIRNSALVSTHSIVRGSVWIGARELRHGTQLRLMTTIGQYAGGSLVTVHHITEGTESELPVVVLEDGRGFDLTRENMRYFTLCVTGGKLVHFPDEPEEYPRCANRIVRGATVRLRRDITSNYTWYRSGARGV